MIVLYNDQKVFNALPNCLHAEGLKLPVIVPNRRLACRQIVHLLAVSMETKTHVRILTKLMTPTFDVEKEPIIVITLVGKSSQTFGHSSSPNNIAEGEWQVVAKRY